MSTSEYTEDTYRDVSPEAWSALEDFAENIEGREGSFEDGNIRIETIAGDVLSLLKEGDQVTAESTEYLLERTETIVNSPDSEVVYNQVTNYKMDTIPKRFRRGCSKFFKNLFYVGRI